LRLPGQYDERLLGAVGLQGPYYNWNRWYLPGVGRYLELDPIAVEGGLNGGSTPEWYSYGAGNPLTYTDPDGRNPAAGAAGGAVVCGPVCAAVGAAIGTGAVWVAACTATNTCPWSRPICRDTPRPPPGGPGKDCDAQYAADVARCGSVPMRSRPSCYESAMTRKNLCEQGLPLPPLFTG